jgi:iron transport multicopper oxidase
MLAAPPRLLQLSQSSKVYVIASGWFLFLVIQIILSPSTVTQWFVICAILRWNVLTHAQTIIEVDGVNVQPLTVDSIQIFAGQRYSFVLNANQPIKNYWIRANPNIGTTGSNGGVNSAILRYLLAPNADPTTTQTPNSNPLLETSLHPLSNPAAPGLPSPGGADVAINLAVAFDFPTLKFRVNGATFIPPTAPVLLQILSGAQTAQDLLPPGSLYVLPPNKVIEITIPGGSIGSPV